MNFIANLSSALRNEGYIFFITISPEYSITYENLDYNRISTLVDRILFLQNVWDMKKQPPSPISNISVIRPFIEHVTKTVSPGHLKKVFLSDFQYAEPWCATFIRVTILIQFNHEHLRTKKCTPHGDITIPHSVHFSLVHSSTILLFSSN